MMAASTVLIGKISFVPEALIALPMSVHGAKTAITGPDSFGGTESNAMGVKARLNNITTPYKMYFTCAPVALEKEKCFILVHERGYKMVKF